MSNPIYNTLNKAQNTSTNSNNNFIQKLQEFKNTFSGNPKDKVQELLNNGTMSQNEFNQLAQMVNSIMGIK